MWVLIQSTKRYATWCERVAAGKVAAARDRGAVVPAGKIAGVRVSATDWVEGGWDLTQTIELGRKLKQGGVDYNTASSGGLSPLQKISVSAGYQVPFAAGIKQATGVATFAVGLITEPRQAEDIVATGKADASTRHALRPALALARGR